ncbi:unnamed protein product [Moneuplotes crassus]|uniref:Uncharacterized protein n=1 Tax=Euplotes crassus TaxID=5936 RepID=A0AAD1X5T5_EUPCR|nr:unnamed protein product [Moneuplotes crassus]
MDTFFKKTHNLEEGIYYLQNESAMEVNFVEITERDYRNYNYFQELVLMPLNKFMGDKKKVHSWTKKSHPACDMTMMIVTKTLRKIKGMSLISQLMPTQCEIFEFDDSQIKYGDKLFEHIPFMPVTEKLLMRGKWKNNNYYFLMEILNCQITHLYLDFVIVEIRNAKLRKKNKLISKFMKSNSLKNLSLWQYSLDKELLNKITVDSIQSNKQRLKLVLETLLFSPIPKFPEASLESDVVLS